MKILALDVGNKRIGMALSDELMIMAQPLYTLERKGIQRDLDALEQIIQDHGVVEIVVGLPRNMDGSIGEQGEKTKKFADVLKQTLGKDIHFFDERLTTSYARKVMRQNDIKQKDGKKIVDTIAAVVILEGFLAARKNAKRKQTERKGKDMDLNDANKPIILLDEDGKEVEFELIQSIEVEGKEYAILAPADEEDGDEAYIFGVSLDDDGEMELREIEDDEEYEKVASVIEEE